MQEPIVCEDCGTKVPAGSHSCPNCGLDFEVQDTWEERVAGEIGEAFPLPPEKARHGRAEDYHGKGRRAELAGFGSRFAAYFVDCILTSVLAYGSVAAPVVALTFSSEYDPENPPPLIFGLLLVSAFTIPFLYFTLMEASNMQATLGKKLVGIRVTDLNGQQISYGRSGGRYMGKILSGMTLGIGFLMAAFTRRKQALHDIVASTLVVRG